MFEEVNFKSYGGITNEDEYAGGSVKGIITLSQFMNWMNDVNASKNKKYIKCLNVKSNKITINSIVDVVFSSDLVHKNTRDVPYGVKVAFKEGYENESSMPFQQIYDLFSNIVVKCNETGVDVNTVEVFLIDEKGKLTQFGWYYDDTTDTAILHKNMNNRVVKDFIHNPEAENIVIRAAKTATTPDSIIDDLEKIEKQMKELELKKDKLYNKLEAM